MPRAAIGVRQEDQEIKCQSDNNFNNRNALSDRHKYLAPPRGTSLFTLQARCIFTIAICTPGCTQFYFNEEREIKPHLCLYVSLT